MLMIIVTIY